MPSIVKIDESDYVSIFQLLVDAERFEQALEEMEFQLSETPIGEALYTYFETTAIDYLGFCGMDIPTFYVENWKTLENILSNCHMEFIGLCRNKENHRRDIAEDIMLWLRESITEANSMFLAEGLFGAEIY